MSEAQRQTVRSTALTAALATTPFLAINLAQIAVHNGSFIHFSKWEALKLTVMLCFALWVVVAIVLIICARSTSDRRFLYAFTASTVFAILATAIEPGWWLQFFDFLNGGFPEWIFRTGVVATALSLVLWRQKNDLAHVR